MSGQVSQGPTTPQRAPVDCRDHDEKWRGETGRLPATCPEGSGTLQLKRRKGGAGISSCRFAGSCHDKADFVRSRRLDPFFLARWPTAHQRDRRSCRWTRVRRTQRRGGEGDSLGARGAQWVRAEDNILLKIGEAYGHHALAPGISRKKKGRGHETYLFPQSFFWLPGVGDQPLEGWRT